MDRGDMLNSKEKKLLHQLVLKAEAEIAAQIHIAFYYKASQSNVMEEAKKYFHKLRLHRSADKNTVLIYILQTDHQFAILGDEGIHEKVPGTYWEELCAKLSEQFKKGNFYHGLVECIEQLKWDVKQHFPKR